jgi:L-lactate dehydrogenase
MKVGIIGAGAVGSACALALVMRGAAREVVLVDRTRERARAVATDMRYGAPLSSLVDIRDGDFNDLTGAALVMITAGVNEKTGGATDRSDAAGRLKLLDINRGIYESLIPRIVEAASDAVILVVTDPPDPLADIVRSQAHHDRVLSTGTYLDSLRFRVHLAGRLGVSPSSVEAMGAYVLVEDLQVMGRWMERPYLFVFHVIGALAAIVLAVSVRSRRDELPFPMVISIFLSAFGNL